MKSTATDAGLLSFLSVPNYNPSPMPAKPHILINGLSIGSGGGYTVARELFRHLAMLRPDWSITLALTSGHTLHEQLKAEPGLPSNTAFLWADPSSQGRVARSRYERNSLTQWARERGVSAVLQLNGMIVPGIPAPTLSHCQDPWPYRPEAWSGLKSRFIAFLKRRENARAFRGAAALGFTSHYLQDLMTARLGITPRHSEVFYNGLPDGWIDRAAGPLPDWGSRPMEIVSVSNVGPYKRQDLVIRALPALLARPGMGDLVYRIAGHIEDAERHRLTALIKSLNVGRHVVIEGRVSDERVQQLLTTSRAFVLMSVCESFGIPAIEAMTFGAPVVTSDCCAMPEVCGNAAILSPVDQIAPLVDNLHRVLTDAETAQSLRVQGALRARQFRWPETAAQMARCFEQIMG